MGVINSFTTYYCRECGWFTVIEDNSTLVCLCNWIHLDSPVPPLWVPVEVVIQEGPVEVNLPKMSKNFKPMVIYRSGVFK